MCKRDSTCLAVILVGENPASQVYVRGKINDCAQCGIESRSINLPADTTQETLLAEVKKLADDPAVHGILVQLPLPQQFPGQRQVLFCCSQLFGFHILCP